MPPSKTPPVLDPSWEQQLQAGQEGDQQVGSIEPELAVLHLLRHARMPESLSEQALAQTWANIAEHITPIPWWRRRAWLAWSAPVAVCGLVAVILLRQPEDGEQRDPLTSPTESLTSFAMLEQQFMELQPEARRNLNSQIEDGRTQLRSELLAAATRREP